MRKLIIAHSQYFLFLINAGERETKNQGVKCERGYHWTGDPWLPVQPHGSQPSVTLVPCPNKCDGEEGGAGEGVLYLMRKDIDDHIKARCPKRSYKCPHCKVRGTYASITQEHDMVCNKKKIPCPNDGCPLFVKRGKMRQHLISSCNYTEVPCEYRNLGCEDKMLRRDAEEHKTEGHEKHVDLALDIISLREEHHLALMDGDAVVFSCLTLQARRSPMRASSLQLFTPTQEVTRRTSWFTSMVMGQDTAPTCPCSSDRWWGCTTAVLPGPLWGPCVLPYSTRWPTRTTIARRLSLKPMTCTSRQCLCNLQFISHSHLTSPPIMNTEYLKGDTVYFSATVIVQRICAHVC